MNVLCIKRELGLTFDVFCKLMNVLKGECVLCLSPLSKWFFFGASEETDFSQSIHSTIIVIFLSNHSHITLIFTSEYKVG